MRIFLTGANGYVGNLLTERLAALPDVETVTGIGLSERKVPMPPKATFRRLDIRSPEVVDAIAGHDIVVHTAAVVLWSADMSERERDDINLNGMRSIAEAARKAGVRRFVHASSMAAYDPDLARGKSDITEDFPIGNSRSAFYYWNAKAAAEKVISDILAQSTVLTFLRPIYIIGPRNRKVIESYRKNAVKFLGHNPRRQFIHEEDVASAFIHAVRTDMPGAFNVVPDDFLRLNDVWKIVGAKFAPTLPLKLAEIITALRWRYLRSPIHPSWVQDMLVDFTASNAKLKTTGWQPTYNSEQALRSAL